MDAQKCDLCRLCLGSINGCDELLLNISDHLINSILLITGLQVVSDPGRSEYICSQCHSLLEQCVEFRNICINNDGVFRGMLATSNHDEGCEPDHEMSAVKYIKIEPVDLGEPADDINENLESNFTLTLEEAVEASVGRRRNSGNNNNDVEKHPKAKRVYRRLQCKQCDKMIVDFNMKDHMEIHNPNREKQYCPHCPKKYAHSKDLKHHIDIRHGRTANGADTKSKNKRKLSCPHCSKDHMTIRQLDQHIKEDHNIEIPYPCQQCDKSYNSQNSLNAHCLAIHSSEKRYACKFCEEKFPRTSMRSYHQRMVHSTFRPFACEYCDKAFLAKSALAKHYRIHVKRKALQEKLQILSE